jgi:acyl-CoA thioester hydrolase
MGATHERAAADAGAPRFAAYFRARHYEADAVGHVNNAAYLHSLEQAAIEHSAAVG